jgi:hypothetical protein
MRKRDCLISSRFRSSPLTVWRVGHSSGRVRSKSMWWPFGSAHKPNRRIPRRRQRPSPVFSAYRPPSYQRPSVQPYVLDSGEWSATSWGKNLRMWSLRPQWFVLSVVAHILLLGELATVLFPISVSERSMAAIPVPLNQAQTAPRADTSATRRQ